MVVEIGNQHKKGQAFMGISEEIKQAANDFYQEVKNEKNGRYLSWEHCYKSFFEARQQISTDELIDYLSLQLAFYLASWGMYRGSSFLLSKDYKIHIPVVKEILSSKYNSLTGITCCDLKLEENQNLLSEISNYLKVYYNSVRESVKNTEIKSELSSTLITKILMGTLGCVPAYDRYFIYGIKKHKITTGTYNLNSILKLCDFYQLHHNEFQLYFNKMNIDGIPYPQMKFLDMTFWQIGFVDDKT